MYLPMFYFKKSLLSNIKMIYFYISYRYLILDESKRIFDLV